MESNVSIYIIDTMRPDAVKKLFKEQLKLHLRL